MPCVGIDGAGEALKALSVKWQACNVYDLEARYRDHLSSLGCELHLGKVAGDVCQASLQDLERPVDLLVSGPPCPPWAGNGNHQGQSDCRAEVSVAVLRIVIALVKVGDLYAVCLENVKGIVQKGKRLEESFMDQVLRILTREVCEFHWDVTQLQASDFNLAQQRVRVFLRGVRKSSFPNGVPPALEPFGEKTLHEFLSPDLPCTSRSKLTKVMAQNLKDAEKCLKTMLEKGEVQDSDLVVFPLDRADGKVYQRRYTTNLCPTLTTNNQYLFVSSMDFDKKDQDRKFFRFLHPSERMVLQGFGKDVLLKSKDTVRIKASGNAYPVPLLIAVLHGILLVLKDSITKSLQAEGNIDGCQSCLERFDLYMEECAKKGAQDPKKGKTKKQKGMKRPAARKSPKSTTKKVKKTMKKQPALQRYKYNFLSSSSS